MSQFRATNIPEYNLSITCDDTNSLRLKANYEMSFARRLWNSSLIWSSSTRTKWPSIPKARVCNNFVSVLDITCKPVFTITIICLKSSSNHPLKKDKTANVDAFETIYGPLKLLNYWSHRHILFFLKDHHLERDPNLVGSIDSWSISMHLFENILADLVTGGHDFWQYSKNI